MSRETFLGYSLDARGRIAGMRRAEFIAGVGFLFIESGLSLAGIQIDPTWGYFLLAAGIILVLLGIKDWLLPRQEFQRLDIGNLPPPVPDDETRRRRIDLVCSWRAMVTDVNRQYLEQGDYKSEKFQNMTALLESHRSFPSLRPYLSQETKSTIWGNTIFVHPSQSSMIGELHCVLQDIDDIEKKWGLR